MTERELQIKVADYICDYYPHAIFHSDFGSGAKEVIDKYLGE